MSKILTTVLVSMLMGLSSTAAPKIKPTLNFALKSTSWNQRLFSSKPKLKYYGGPILANVKVIGVFWGPNVDATVTSQIGDFYQTLTNSSMMDWLAEYDTNIKAVNGNAGTNQKIGYGSYGGDYTITPVNVKTDITGEEVQTELLKQIEDKNLPATDDNSLYMIHFPPGIKITDGGLVSCRDFCAYHASTRDAANQNVFYGVIPDFTKSACGPACGPDDIFGNYTSSASHEVIEAVTDPEDGDNNGKFGAPGAWYDVSLDQEIGDICAYKPTSTIKSKNGTDYIIQPEWSNKRKSCEFVP